MLLFKREDFEALPKERLIDMLMEWQTEQAGRIVEPQPYTPFNPGDYTGNPSCWSPDGWCSNPFHDCINCPGKQARPGESTWTTNTTTTLTQNEFLDKFVEKKKSNLND